MTPLQKILAAYRATSRTEREEVACFYFEVNALETLAHGPLNRFAST